MLKSRRSGILDEGWHYDSTQIGIRMIQVPKRCFKRSATVTFIATCCLVCTKIQAAYEALCEDNKRARYDTTVGFIPPDSSSRAWREPSYGRVMLIREILLFGQ